MESKIIIKNKNNVKVYISNVGAGIIDITLPLGNKDKSILLHPLKDEEYFYSNQYFGKCCGRTAGRITGSKFVLNGNEYHIENDLPYDALHGGKDNISLKVFDVKEVLDNKVVLSYTSKDGESGYPGDLTIVITYFIAEDNKLVIYHDYASNKDTLCNLTSHMYFNLNKDLKNNILDEKVYMNAKYYGKLNEDNVAISLNQVNESFDFNKPMKIKEHIYDEEVQNNLGYNHPFVISHDKEYDASLEDDSSNIKLLFKSSYDALQFFTCNYPDTTLLNNGKTLDKYDAVCMEFQHFPNGINSPFIFNKKDIALKNKKYHEEIEIKFVF